MTDFLFRITEWLRTTPLIDLSLWLNETSINAWIVTHFWAIPVFQVVHILAIAASFGSILMINARIMGLNGEGRTIAQTTNRFMPWIWWALVALILSGLCMIVAEPIRELINPFFWIKMVLVVTAILITVWFHKGILRDIREEHDIGATERTVAGLLVLLWMAIMFCGRWIAYAPT
jgi:magnesium-transporting ATPase (P-type)